MMEKIMISNQITFSIQYFFTPYGHKVDCTIKKEGVYDNVYTNLRYNEYIFMLRLLL